MEGDNMKEQTYFVFVMFGSDVHITNKHLVGMENGTLPATPCATTFTISTRAPGTSWGNSIIMRVSEAKLIFPYRRHLECGSGIRPGWVLNSSVEEQDIERYLAPRINLLYPSFYNSCSLRGTVFKISTCQDVWPYR
jgi:hypothetical protein